MNCGVNAVVGGGGSREVARHMSDGSLSDDTPLDDRHSQHAAAAAAMDRASDHASDDASDDACRTDEVLLLKQEHVTPSAAPSAADGCNMRRPLPFSVARVAAPMVGTSDLAFRLLCRRHGATLCYTEMFFADQFVASAEYRDAVFFSQLHAGALDRPLAVQFAANDASDLVTAARIVEPYCAVVDLNLGCPEKRALEGTYGAYLLDREHWPRVYGLVRALAAGVAVPVSCKVRLLPSLAMTLRFCRGLQAAGCSLLAVHGRQRGSPTRRRSGPADLHASEPCKASNAPRRVVIAHVIPPELAR